MPTDSVNSFRKARGKKLSANIATVAKQIGRPLDILDVGGRADYWDNVDLANVRTITLLNLTIDEMHTDFDHKRFVLRVGDASDLSDFADISVDLVHSNSVIEHMGTWTNMGRMASELRRVGRHGWIQTPAWVFPIEPHWKMPFIHWMARPAQAAMLRLRKRFRHTSIDKRRSIVESVSLLSRSELKHLFPSTPIWTERFLTLPKSYTMFW